MPQTREELKAKKRAYEKHRRDWLREHGICVWCGHAAAEPGKVLCIGCEIKNSENHARAWECKSPEEKKAATARKGVYLKERKRRFRENGQCTDCGKKLAEGYPFRICLECRIKRKRYYDADREKKGHISWEQRTSGYYCYRCCKPIEFGERNLCPECYEKTAASALRMCESQKYKENLAQQKKFNALIFNKRG